MDKNNYYNTRLIKFERLELHHKLLLIDEDKHMDYNYTCHIYNSS